MGDSVAVQVGLPEKAVTVKLAGSDSEAVVSSSVTDPEAQARDTVTSAPLSGTKSLLTVKAAVVVLVMVQVAVPRSAIAMLMQAAWLAA
jgi:hypothetical protein